MTMFERLKKNKAKALTPMRAALERLYREEGIPLGPSLKEHLRTIVEMRTYKCQNDCRLVVCIGDRQPTTCSECGRPLVELEIPESKLITTEFRNALVAQAHALYAMDLSRDGDLAGAEKSLSIALEQYPELESAYHNRSEARIAIGDLDGAIEDCNEVLRRNPKAADTMLNRGSAKAQKGDYVGGRDDTDKAFELGINLPIAYFNRGACRLYTGDAVGAREDLERFIELAPSDDQTLSAHQLLAQINASETS